MELKPKPYAHPSLQMMSNGDPIDLEEMSNDITRDTECALEVEEMLNEQRKMSK